MNLYLANIPALQQWRAPEHRLGPYHNIPIDQLEYVRGIIKDALLDMEYTYTFRFRGPRKPRSQSTPKKDATHFAVFFKEKPVKKAKPKPPLTIQVDGYWYRLVET